MAFESTRTILGIGEAQRAKKNDAWKKLMDVAGMGADIWGTVSGRKYQTGERVAGQAYETDKLATQHGYNMEELGQRLENDKSFQIFKIQNPEKPANQLYSEYLQTPEGQAWQNDQEKRQQGAGQFEHGLRMEEIRAGKSSSGMSSDAWKTYDNAINRATASFYEQDQNGRFVLRKGVTPDQIKKFLYGFLDPAFASENDIPGLRRAFDMWLTNPDFPGATAQTENKDTDTINMLLEGFKNLAKTMAPSPANAEPVRPAAAGAVGSDSGMGGLGTQILDRSQREYSLEKNLKGILSIPGMEDIDKQLAQRVLTESSKKGFLSEEDYQTFMAVLQTLQKKYGGIGATK